MVNKRPLEIFYKGDRERMLPEEQNSDIYILRTKMPLNCNNTNMEVLIQVPAGTILLSLRVITTKGMISEVKHRTSSRVQHPCRRMKRSIPVSVLLRKPRVCYVEIFNTSSLKVCVP